MRCPEGDSRRSHLPDRAQPVHLQGAKVLSDPQQMQQALSSVDNFGKDVDSVLDGLHSSVNLQAEVRQARSMYERAMEVQQSLQKLYRHLRSAESV